MNVAAIRFTAKLATNGCGGCLFDAERSSVCRDASMCASERNLPDCESGPGYIYVLDESDPRQMKFPEVV